MNNAGKASRTCRASYAIVKLNLRNLKVPYLVTGICVGLVLINTIIMIIINQNDSDISIGLYFWLLILLAPIFIPAHNFRRIFNLGGRRESFFWGSLMTHILLAASVSFINTVIYYLCDKTNLFGTNIINLVEVFDWSGHGAIAAFFQQFAFLFWMAAFIHTLTAAQDKWYGWAADFMILIVLTVFIPIAPLRASVVFFFYLIIFSYPPVQIAACLLIGLGIYALNKPILARKAM